MAADEKTPYVLRPEARPLRWDLLNASQQSAFRKILDALKDARRDVDEAARQKSAENPPNLPATPDRFRSSRLVFLSGKRGTGKSTVLVSLFEAFLDLDHFCNVDDEGNGIEAEGSKKEDKVDKIDKQDKTDEEKKKEADKKRKRAAATEVRESLKGLKERIIWLDPLDMEPLPRPVNLLAAILARIDRAAARFNQKREDKTYQSGLLSLASGEKALHGLRKLSSDVAIAWDGNVDARASALDPDAYAAEVTRVEDARIGINTSLNKALDELAQELGKSSYVKNPFFVLPIDDYDLNPLRSLELLHLIRMVSSPRLFIIVLGDVRTAEIMFNLKKSGDFARVLTAASTPRSLSVSSSEIGSIARSLSGHAIRKLVPPGQRIELGPLEVEEALDFHPGNLRNDLSKTGDTLRKLLEQLPVDIETAHHPSDNGQKDSAQQSSAQQQPPQQQQPSHQDLSPKQPESSQNTNPGQKVSDHPKHQSIAGQEIDNFQKFLCFNVLHEESRSAATAKTGEALKEKFPYTGAALLKAAPRYIADLWFSIRELLNSIPETGGWKGRLNALIDFVGKETHRALEEDELLSIRYRERFVEALGVSPDEEWLHAMKFVEARSVSVPGRRVTLRKESCVLYANYRRSWDFWNVEKGSHNPKEGTRIDIGDRAKALIILLHDLLALEREAGIIGSHALSPDSLNLGLAYASWDVGGEAPVIVPWPTPAWTSFWEFDQFSRIWESALRGDFWAKADITEAERRSFLLYTWIAGAAKVLQESDPKPKIWCVIPQSPEEVTRTDKDSRWANLAEVVKKLAESASDATPRSELIRSWLFRLPLLLAPESGMMTTNDSLGDAIEEILSYLEEFRANQSDYSGALDRWVRNRRSIFISRLTEDKRNVVSLPSHPINTRFRVAPERLGDSDKVASQS